MFDLPGMIRQMQENMLQSKKQLDNITVESEAGNGAVKVVATASKNIVSISISPGLLENPDKEELEDLLLVAVNRALSMSESKATEEMKKLTGNMLPPGFDFPGL
ncbi:MAG: YbaB/EbfC family nucleoid-associated protein [Sphingobacteriales bacterium]|nr:MAG: YbaB/EbfC family nucleoid-associated protein [Sphingobacteriales bacterium]